MARLTKAQYLTLRGMEHRDRVPSSAPLIRRRIGMMRVLGERGIVGRNLHDEWYLTAKGRAAIEAYEAAAARPHRNAADGGSSNEGGES